MRGAFPLAWVLAATPAMAADTLASMPSDLSVTVYRAPSRSSGSINLDNLGGFALVSETRTVHLPAGVTRLRFEGVADGIEPSSAIVTGLPAGVMEKNREGTIRSDAEGVVFETSEGIEALRCSGLPETFSFSGVGDLSATPTLSVLV